MDRLRFQVVINGKEVCTAGIDSQGDVIVEAGYVRLERPEEPIVRELFADVPPGEDYERCWLRVAGSLITPMDALQWIREPLVPGDVVSIHVLGPGASDPPAVREPDHPF